MFFNDEILKKIDNYEMELPADDWAVLSKKLNQKRRKKAALWWYAAAASVALVIGFGFLFNNFENNENNKRFAQKIEKNNENIILKQKNISENFIDENVPPTLTDGIITSRTISCEDDDDITEVILEKIEPNNQINNNQQPTNQQLTIEQAEKLMQEKEKSAEIVNRKSKIVNNRYFASLSASASPTNFSAKDKTPTKMFVPALGGKGVIRSSTRFDTRHDLPLAFGLSVGIPLAKRLYLNTGLTYTYIHSKTEIFDRENNDLLSNDNQTLHYLGIPLMLSYRIIDGKVFKLYCSAGGAAEKGLIEQHSKRIIKDITPENAAVPTNTDEKNKRIDGFQFSLNANIGAGIALYRGLELYIEPGFAWYIPAKKYPQPISRRTKNPYFINITAGLRFNFNS